MELRLALNFAKKTAPTADTTPQKTPTSPAAALKAATPPAHVAAKGIGSSFLKKGAEAKQAMIEQDAQDELAKESKNKLWRFWMPDGEDRQITFLDGNIDEDGMLDIPMYHEHQLQVAGKYEHFVCTQEKEGYCPICARGDSKPYLVGVMTVLDHSEHKVKSGPNAGKTIANTRKLFVAKKATIKILSKIAVKREGLSGATFDVSREGDKSANVGSQFDFTDKNSFDDIAAACGLKVEDLVPADYESEITYKTADELVELGVGKAPTGVGYSPGVQDKASDLKSQL